MEAGKSTAVNKSKKHKKFGPERAYFSALASKNVAVHCLSGDKDHGPTYTGKLLWVDQYTICVRLHINKVERLFYKHAIQSVEPDNRGQPNDQREGSV